MTNTFHSTPNPAAVRQQCMFLRWLLHSSKLAYSYTDFVVSPTKSVPIMAVPIYTVDARDRYSTLKALGKYRCSAGKQTHNSMDGGCFFFSSTKQCTSVLLECIRAGNRKIGLVPAVRGKHSLLFDVDDLCQWKWDDVVRVVESRLPRVFGPSQMLLTKNEQFPKYHFIFNDIVVSKETRSIVTKSFNLLFKGGVMDLNVQSSAMRYPGFDKFCRTTNRFLPNTRHLPIGRALNEDTLNLCHASKPTEPLTKLLCAVGEIELVVLREDIPK